MNLSKECLTTLIWARKGCSRRGFTLVELLVAMTIATVIFAIIWKFLDTTANASREITSASATIDDARIGLEEMSKHLQLTAAHASPNSSVDPKIRPKSRQQQIGKITGIYPYSKWQESVVWDGSSPTNPPMPLDPASDPVLKKNPRAVFNGVVVLGSFSYPLSFDSRITDTLANKLRVPETPRGTRRLNNPNPFIVSKVGGGSALTDGQWKSRLIEVIDAEGFKQFATVDSVEESTNTITLKTPLDKKGTSSGVGRNFGVEVATGATDRYYNTAALDMFWFYVRKDPDPSSNNYQLVRERLCAPTAVLAYQNNGASFQPRSYLAGNNGCGKRETIVIANQVASFNIWFDCAEGQGRNVYTHGLAAPGEWDVVNENNCVSSDPGAKIQNARIAHVRLSTYTMTERRSLSDSNYFFQNGRLVAFDANLNYEGASPVTTLQSDVFMRNFLYW